MTRKEIELMANTCQQYYSCACCPYNPEDISRYIGDEWKGGCPNYDRKLVYAMYKGYEDVSKYKAKIKRLNKEMSDIRKKTAEEFAKRICEMLWNLGIDKDGNRFSYGDLTSENVLYIAKQFGVDIDDRVCKENNMATAHMNKLVEQDAEIERLKEENANLLKICEEKFTFDTTQNNKYSIFNTVRKLAVQDFADKLKGKLQDFGDGGEKGAYITEKDIDELLRGYEK